MTKLDYERKPSGDKPPPHGFLLALSIALLVAAGYLAWQAIWAANDFSSFDLAW